MKSGNLYIYPEDFLFEPVHQQELLNLGPDVISKIHIWCSLCVLDPWMFCKTNFLFINGCFRLKVVLFDDEML